MPIYCRTSRSIGYSARRFYILWKKRIFICMTKVCTVSDIELFIVGNKNTIGSLPWLCPRCVEEFRYTTGQPQLLHCICDEFMRNKTNDWDGTFMSYYYEFKAAG